MKKCMPTTWDGREVAAAISVTQSEEVLVANRASGFLATDARERQRVRERVLRFYEARSEIVHSGPQRASPFRNGAAFVTGFDLARRSLFKLLREGAPGDWNELEVLEVADE